METSLFYVYMHTYKYTIIFYAVFGIKSKKVLAEHKLIREFLFC